MRPVCNSEPIGGDQSDCTLRRTQYCFPRSFSNPFVSYQYKTIVLYDRTKLVSIEYRNSKISIIVQINPSRSNVVRKKNLQNRLRIKTKTQTLYFRSVDLF